MRVRGGWALSLCVLWAVGCAPPSTDKRCDDLSDWLEGTARSLPQGCEADLDCQVVFVRPDEPVAASRSFSDPSIARVLETYEATCGEIPRGRGALAAVCAPVLADVEAEDGTSVEVAIGRQCTLVGDYVVDRPDVGTDPDPVEPEPCACQTDAQCPGGTRCGGCACWVDSLCGQACRAAATCGALDALGVGVSPASCPPSCEAAIARAPASYQAFAACMVGADCDTITECARLLP